jgi:DNA ligase-1
MNSPWNIIIELESDNSRLNKEAIIEREAHAGNDEFFEGIGLALDPMITFGIKQVQPKETGGRGFSWDNFKKLTISLASREITGGTALNAVANARMLSTVEQWNNWYRRILIKDLRCGVSEKTVNKAVKKHSENYMIPVFSCQLAHDGANHPTKLVGTKLIETKLDGVRVLAVVYPSGYVDLFSRNGKELLNFDHIKQQIGKHAIFFAEPVVLDGEVMSATFQDLMKQVYRKYDVEATDAVLHLFDILTLREFQSGRGEHRQVDRSVSLAAWYSAFSEHMPNVSVVGQELVDLDTEEGREQFRNINELAVAGGYEGIMIKDPQAVYECKRSTSWLKQKPFIEVSLEVRDVEEGTGKNLGRLGALVCSGIDDNKHISVNVGSGFSDSQRDDFWINRSGLCGTIVEVRADAITQNQDGTYSLRFPRFKGFRGFSAGEKI